MELKDALSGVLVKAHNWTEAEVSSLFNEDGSFKDDGLDSVLARQAEAVKKVNDARKKERDDAFARGIREKGEDYMKVLKESGVELGDAKTVEEVRAKLLEYLETVKKPSDLDDDKVKNSKLYRELEKKFQADLKAKDDEHKKAWQERDAKEQRERTLGDVKTKAKAILDELKPVLPEDQKKAANQLRFLMAEFDSLDYEVDGEEIIIKDKDGKRLETANGLPLTFTDFVKSKASDYYEFKVSDARGSAGDVTKGTSNKGAAKLQKPANRQEYAQQLHKISEDKSLSANDKAKSLAELKELAKDLA